MISNWRDYFFCLLMELFFLTLAIFIVINLTPLYWIDIHLMHLERATGVRAGAIMADYVRMVFYIQNPFDWHLNFQYFTSSLDGQRHFRDVKQLVLINNLAMVGLGTVGLNRLWKLFKKHQGWRMIIPIRVIGVLLAALVTLVFVNFDRGFIIFHELLFQNNDWVFNPKLDPIIDALPVGFFIQSFVIVVGLIAGFNIIVYHLSKRNLKLSK